MPSARTSSRSRAARSTAAHPAVAGGAGTLFCLNRGTGEEIWKFDLPASAQATPMTYTLNGKQYVVIAAGGHGKLGTKQGDYVLAFTLP